MVCLIITLMYIDILYNNTKLIGDNSKNNLCNRIIS